MAEKHEEFKVHMLSFTDEELDRIICALYDSGDDELADEIDSLISDACGCCSPSDIATLTIDIDTSATQEKVDKLLKSANDACDALDRLRGDF